MCEYRSFCLDVPEYVAYSCCEHTPLATRRMSGGSRGIVTWSSLLVALLVVGQLLLGLLTDLGRRDLARTQAAAEKALRHANEDP
jgi:hypothetical protein